MKSPKINPLLLFTSMLLFYNIASFPTPILEPQCKFCPKIPKKPIFKRPKFHLPRIRVPNLPNIPPKGSGSACPPPPGNPTCPSIGLKLGICVDLLGGLGNPVLNECCPMLAGLVELEAAICLCVTLKLKALNLNVYVPLMLQLLVQCGKTPPPGYTCSL